MITTIRFFADRNSACDYARLLTRSHASGDREIFAVVDGPEDNFAVVDLATAIDLGGSYEWFA